MPDPYIKLALAKVKEIQARHELEKILFAKVEVLCLAS